MSFSKPSTHSNSTNAVLSGERRYPLRSYAAKMKKQAQQVVVQPKTEEEIFAESFANFFTNSRNFLEFYLTIGGPNRDQGLDSYPKVIQNMMAFWGKRTHINMGGWNERTKKYIEKKVKSYQTRCPHLHKMYLEFSEYKEKKDIQIVSFYMQFLALGDHRKRKPAEKDLFNFIVDASWPEIGGNQESSEMDQWKKERSNELYRYLKNQIKVRAETTERGENSSLLPFEKKLLEFYATSGKHVGQPPLLTQRFCERRSKLYAEWSEEYKSEKLVNLAKLWDFLSTWPSTILDEDSLYLRTYFDERKCEKTEDFKVILASDLEYMRLVFPNSF